jgi:ATP-binding cassette subfamily A (ABC1) protein 2
MSMLTGLIPASSGTALIYGKDICTDINSIRNNLGWCPQHNVLFDKLTVEEHLWFYAKLKQMNEFSIKELIDNMLRDTGLEKKRNNMINTLSGGMQRKLSVGIAFVGDAKLVILDEPTAGVDPHARRAVWDLLLKYKQGRTIILSTHHMDEAELLGDRIAIISNGRLQCCGTALFLKNALGEGNHLTITKDLAQLENEIIRIKEDEKSVSEMSTRNIDNLLEFMRAYVPSVYLKEESLREYQFIIPLKERSNQNFWNLFKALEENKLKLKIDSYGIQDVSLEEIFIKAAQIKCESSDAKLINIEEDGEDSSESSLAHDEATISSDTLSTGSSSCEHFKQSDSLYDLDYMYADLEKGYRFYFKQFKAIVIKRFLYNKRNWKSLLTQIILPALFVCIAMTVALSAPGFLDLPALELSAAQFYPLTKPEGVYVPYSYSLRKDNCTNRDNEANSDATSLEIVQTLSYIVGIGSTCVLNQNNLTFKDLLNPNYTQNSNANPVFSQKYFGRSESCKVAFNPRPDVDFRYFQYKNSTKSSFLSFANKKVNALYPNCECLSDFRYLFIFCLRFV